MPDREPQAELPGIGQSSRGPRRGDRRHSLPRGGDGRHFPAPVLRRQHQPPGVAPALHAGPGCHRCPGQAGLMSCCHKRIRHNSPPRSHQSNLKHPTLPRGLPTEFAPHSLPNGILKTELKNDSSFPPSKGTHLVALCFLLLSQTWTFFFGFWIISLKAKDWVDVSTKALVSFYDCTVILA